MKLRVMKMAKEMIRISPQGMNRLGFSIFKLPKFLVLPLNEIKSLDHTRNDTFVQTLRKIIDNVTIVIENGIVDFTIIVADLNLEFSLKRTVLKRALMHFG